MKCRCGLKIQEQHLGRHIKSLWHREHERIKQMVKIGLSQAEIARQLQVSRMYISQLMAKVKHG